MSDYVETTKEAGQGGGFRGILAVRGLMVDLNKIPPPQGWETTKEQMQASLEDAAILEMVEGEDEFELKDSKFSCLWPYADEGKKPHANGIWMRCAVASAEAVGRVPSSFIGEYVTLRKIPTVLFKKTIIDEDKKPVLDGEGNKTYEDVVTENYFCFIADETADSENVKEKVRNAIAGLNEKAALRKLLIAYKQFPEYKTALNDGTLGEMLNLVVVDGKFQKPEDEEDGDVQEGIPIKIVLPPTREEVDTQEELPF